MGKTTQAKPPPIFLQNVPDYAGMLKTLSKFIEIKKILTKSIANNAVKINVESSDDYHKLASSLRSNN